jgi:GntR family transcriptional regulator
LTIIIQNASPLPIYEQIVQQVRRQILSGELQEGEPLPSIRALAKDLRISVITTRRAYDELEREGYIRTVAGKGSFVGRRSAELVREENLRRIETLLSEAIALAADAGLTDAELADLLRLLQTS